MEAQGLRPVAFEHKGLHGCDFRASDLERRVLWETLVFSGAADPERPRGRKSILHELEEIDHSVLYFGQDRERRSHRLSKGFGLVRERSEYGDILTGAEDLAGLELQGFPAFPDHGKIVDKDLRPFLCP